MFFFRRSKTKVIILVLALATIISLRYNGVSNKELHTADSSRALSINLGDGQCLWTPPIVDVPENITFFKTLIAGFPSGDKRLTYVQMEALTGLSARDEWDFEYLGETNQPFVKANYPHHEGIWGWEGVDLGQVVMVVRNIKRTLVEYHDILWDIGYATTFEDAFETMPNLFQERPPLDDFLRWRDLRVFDEVHWYSWFIDYYMENGLMRDMYTHSMTTPEHWRKVLLPNHYSKEELRYSRYVSDPSTVTPKYDPMCLTIDKGCYPARIISAEKLVLTETGPAEGRKIAEVIQGNEGIDEWMISETAWECIWNELIINKKGLKTFIDREGIGEEQYDFSPEMHNEMWYQLERLINKYSSHYDREAVDLVTLLKEHQESLDITPDSSMRLTYEELMTYHLEYDPFFPDQVPFNSFDDLRKLKLTDIMGPRTRAEYNRWKNSNSTSREGRNLKRENFDFSELDEYLRLRRVDQIKSMNGMFGF